MVPPAVRSNGQASRASSRTPKSSQITTLGDEFGEVGTLKGFLSKDLITQKIDRSDMVRSLIHKIEMADPTKSKKISPLSAKDTFRQIVAFLNRGSQKHEN